jgi:magnesium transporter
MCRKATFVVDQYFPILEALEEKVVELEEVVLDEKFIHETTSRIYHLKRELLSIKRAVSPLVDICSRLMRFDLALLPEDTKPYFRDAGCRKRGQTSITRSPKQLHGQ